jgi:tRNA (cmo5U34)-methyltransferase
VDRPTKTAPPPAGSARDEIFATPERPKQDFDFGGETAAVFDDMLERSVPFYAEVQRMVSEIAADFATPGSAVYDLGCSTGTTFLLLEKALPADVSVRFVGVDNSPEMLAVAREKLAQGGLRNPVELRCEDLERGLVVEDCSVALLILTLQFVRPLKREALVRHVYDGLRDDGCLIMVEKVLGESSTFNRLFIDHYYDLKRRNGYSDLEIAQKREALENVLVPYRLEENRELLLRQGFRHVDVFWKWYNFCGIVAMK